jgi:electron transport complex protein RnfG
MTKRPPYFHGVILGVFCLGFGVMLASTDRVTAVPIAQRALEDKQNSLAQVIPDALHDNNPVQDTLTVTTPEGKAVTVYRARRAGQVTGVAFPIEGTGYGGEIRLMLAVDTQGRILGVRALAHKETPGLGDKIEAAKNDWITRFTGLSLGSPPVEKWKVKKDGGNFDQFSGATITPRGVVKAIRDGLTFFAENKTRMLEAIDEH